MSTLSIAPSFVPVQPRRQAGPQVRLTRRGRLVVFLTSLAIALAAAVLLASGAMGTDHAGTPAHYESYVVGDGENLSGIARQVGSSVLELEQLNHLDSAEILAGQTLRVPAN
jgi:hypothetical protein